MAGFDAQRATIGYVSGSKLASDADTATEARPRSIAGKRTGEIDIMPLGPGAVARGQGLAMQSASETAGVAAAPSTMPTDAKDMVAPALGMKRVELQSLYERWGAELRTRQREAESDKEAIEERQRKLESLESKLQGKLADLAEQEEGLKR